MSGNKNYNKDLRSQILVCSIREEEAASDVLKSLLRLVKVDSKTLDNKSSSLSFKNKIDLLYDIDDLKKDEYSALVKFMEIRNQFIHNPNCSSFVELSEEAPDLTKYLSTNFKNDIADKEQSLGESFENLFNRTLGRLLVLNLEYEKGITNEMNTYVESKAIQNFDSIFNSAYSHWRTYKQSQVSNPFALSTFNILDNEIRDFERYLKFYLLDEQIKVLDKIVNSELTAKDIFNKRADLLAEYKRKKENLDKDDG